MESMITLVNNMALLLVLSIPNRYLHRRFKSDNYQLKASLGGLFGIVAVIGMMVPMKFAEGIVFDARTVLASIAGLYGGPVSAGVFIIIASAYRIYLGGTGAMPGVGVIFTAAIIGVLFRSVIRKKDAPGGVELLGMGIVVHVAMLLWMLMLPSVFTAEAYKAVTVPVMVVFPLGTLLIGLILSDEINNRRVVENVRKSEELYRSVFDESNAPIFVFDASMNFVDTNQAGLDLLGYSKEELMGMSTSDVDANLESTLQSKQELLSGGRLINFEHQLRRKDGTVATVLNNSSVLTDENGVITGVLSTLIDISKRKNAEKALIESEERYRSYIDNAPECVFVADPDGRFLVVNQIACDTTGYSEKELLNMAIPDLTHPESMEDATDHFMRVKTTGKASGEIKFIRKDGSSYCMTVNAIALPHGLFMAFCIDISERIEAEKMMEKYNSFYQAVIKQAPFAAHIIEGTADNMHVVIENKESRRILGEKFEGRNDIDGAARESVQTKFFTPDGKTEIPLWNMPGVRAVRGETVENEQFLFRHTDGTEIFVEASASPIIENGNILASIVTFHDITSRKIAHEMEQKFFEQEKMATIGRITGKMAHDFNNLLGIIMGTSQLLLSEELPEELERDINIIMESALKGRDITRNLLLFAKDQEPKLQQFDLNEKINLIIRSMKTELKPIDVTVNYGSDMDKLLADAGLIENAIINLIQNSIHALSKSEKPELKLKTYHENDTICLEIADNGCGIPEEYKEKIFEPTVTLKGSGDKSGAYRKSITGSGYGMVNVKRCVEKHGGTISFESEIGKGTKFKIVLPLIKSDFSSDEMEQLKQQKVVEGKRILIVEDEPHYGRVLHSLLEKFQHNIDLTTDGGMALDHLKKNVYDLISLDFTLPDIDGMDVYNVIRETNNEVPVIFVSGNMEFMQSMEELKSKDLRVDHLAKPFNNVDYVGKIHDWLS